MIRPSSDTAMLMQKIRKPGTLSTFCLIFTLLLIFFSANLFVAGIKSNHENGTSLMMMKPEAGVEARIIPASMARANRPFAEKMISGMLTWGNDGMRINWRHLSSLFQPGLFSHLPDFHSAFTTVSPKPLLTTAAAWGVLAIRPAIELLSTRQNRTPMVNTGITAPWPGYIICRDTSSL